MTINIFAVNLLFGDRVKKVTEIPGYSSQVETELLITNLSSIIHSIVMVIPNTQHLNTTSQEILLVC